MIIKLHHVTEKEASKIYPRGLETVPVYHWSTRKTARNSQVTTAQWALLQLHPKSWNHSSEIISSAICPGMVYSARNSLASWRTDPQSYNYWWSLINGLSHWTMGGMWTPTTWIFRKHSTKCPTNTYYVNWGAMAWVVKQRIRLRRSSQIRNIKCVWMGYHPHRCMYRVLSWDQCYLCSHKWPARCHQQKSVLVCSWYKNLQWGILNSRFHQPTERSW